jgi:peptide/nickel transport system substrate-binding protein
MLKTGEADIGYLMIGDEAQAIKADPKLRLVDVISAATWWLEFPEQWDSKSPWHDARVRLAANLALDKQTINEVERMGLSRLTGSIIPSALDFTLRLEPFQYDPARAKRLLAEAGYPNGFDAGDLTPLPPFTTFGEAVANYLGAVGIRTQMRTMERAAFFAALREKKLRGLVLHASAALGNAATRLETYVLSTGTYAYGGHADIDALFHQQSGERDRSKREAILHQIQRLMHERVMHAPIYEPASLHGIGPRVDEPAVGLNPLLYFAAPYEDMRLKKP